MNINKEESLKILQDCTDDVSGISDKDVNRMRECYEKERRNMKEYMENANTIWYDEDVKVALEEKDIPVTEENIAKVTSDEFVRSFHEALVAYGNEMIADRVYEVFEK